KGSQVPRFATLVAVEELAPLRLLRGLDAATAEGGVPEQVVVDVGGRVAPRHDGRAQQGLLQEVERAPVDLLLTPAGKGVLVLAEPEVDAGDVDADDLDVLRVADAEAALVREADEL